jgi:hypothetical protein
MMLTAIAKVLGPAKRPGATRDGRIVLSLLAELNGKQIELNLVTKPEQGIIDALQYLTRAGYLTQNGNEYRLQIPAWAIAKAKGNVIWVHLEDYEKLKGAT